MRKRLYNITKEFLIKEYVENKKREKEIAKILNCGITTISRNLKKYSIKTRSNTDFQGINSNSWNRILIECFICGEEFYIKKSRRKRSKIICCSRKCSSKWRKTLKGKNAFSFKDGRTTKDYYCITCGEETSFSSAIYGQGRCRDCCYNFRNHKGKNHWNWQNGKSFEEYPQEFNDKLKLKIRKRDNYTCQKCSITEEEHITVYGQVLSIHHIDYNKKDCKEDNLITLCRECNNRVNFNRNYWTNYFKVVIEKLKEKI